MQNMIINSERLMNGIYVLIRWWKQVQSNGENALLCNFIMFLFRDEYSLMFSLRWKMRSLFSCFSLSLSHTLSFFPCLTFALAHSFRLWLLFTRKWIEFPAVISTFCNVSHIKWSVRMLIQMKAKNWWISENDRLCLVHANVLLWHSPFLRRKMWENGG